MRFTFNEKKTTQAAAILIELDGGTMNYMKLIKLLYIADRQALLKWHRPISGDAYFSLPNGPVLSNLLDIINQPPSPQEESYWYQHISEPDQYSVKLKQNPGTEELSSKEKQLLETVYDNLGQMDVFALSQKTHELPEWEDPEGSSIPIRPEDILREGGKTHLEIERIEKDVNGVQHMKSLLGQE